MCALDGFFIHLGSSDVPMGHSSQCPIILFNLDTDKCLYMHTTCPWIYFLFFGGTSVCLWGILIYALGCSLFGAPQCVLWMYLFIWTPQCTYWCILYVFMLTSGGLALQSPYQLDAGLHLWAKSDCSYLIAWPITLDSLQMCLHGAQSLSGSGIISISLYFI